MPKPPSVSVVMPLYNKRATIARAVDSVLAQTFGDFEVVIVDDGSKDRGADLVEARYSDPRIRVHRQANAGPGAARNAGLALSRGEFVTFLDTDDNWRPTLLEEATATLAAHPECGVFTATFIREPAGVDRWAELPGGGFPEGVWRLEPAMGRQEVADCLEAFHSCTGVYRRDAVTRFGGYYTKERCTFGEDVYLWIQVLLNYPIYRFPTPLAHYHMEDSELGIGARQGRLPLEPVLTDPGPVRAACPLALAEVLELWLAQHAVRAAYMQLERGASEAAAWLLRQFPRIQDLLPKDYARLRLRMKFPFLWSFARKLRQMSVGAVRPEPS